MVRHLGGEPGDDDMSCAPFFFRRYSLHQQLFAQAANQGTRKVRMITIEHLAGSIRTHGLGVINTTVNYAYGFIERKLEVVVEFLSDESVKSRLMADARWVEERHQTGARQDGALHTWNRALETAAFLRRLGTAGDGVPFLDKLRPGKLCSYLSAKRHVFLCMCACVFFITAQNIRARVPWSGGRRVTCVSNVHRVS